MGLGQLLRTGRRSADAGSRRKAVRRIQDEAELIRLACHDPDLEVRVLAVERLRSQTALRRVAVEGEHLDARVRAVRRIEDPRVLAGIMRERKQPDLMMACFEGIRDQEVLAEIARDPGQSLTARRIAINMFADQALLAELITSLRAPALREAALERIQDPELRARLHREENGGAERDPEARALELARITDPDDLAEVLGAFRDSPGAVRALGALASDAGGGSRRAAEILVRQLKHPRPEIRRLALEKLAAAGRLPENELAVLEENDPDPGVRALAASLAKESHGDGGGVQ